MKLLETLTTQQQINILDGLESGIFDYILWDGDPFNDDKTEMAKEYYFSRSGDKTVSPFYERVLGLQLNTDEIIGNTIRSKFIDKWKRLYDVLVTQTYKPLDKMSETETREYGKKTDRTGNNKDTKTSTVTEDGTVMVGTSETTSRTGDTQDNVYGFNSVTPVGDTTSNETVTETVSGKKDDNVTDTDNKTTTDEVIAHDISTNEINSGTDTYTRTGRDESGATLITEEIEMRNLYTFFDIVFADVDSIMTINIYV